MSVLVPRHNTNQEQLMQTPFDTSLFGEIEITSPTESEAPKDIRDLLVGLVVPCYGRIAQARPVGLLSKKVTSAENVYLVRQVDFMNALKMHSLPVHRWFTHEGFPLLRYVTPEGVPIAKETAMFIIDVRFAKETKPVQVVTEVP